MTSNGCCLSCDGTGASNDIETNGKCWDCYGTGHTHQIKENDMPYSVVYEGHVLDVEFRHKTSLGSGSVRYSLYVGEDRVGHVFGSKFRSRMEWTAHVDSGDRNELVKGFATRGRARDFIVDSSIYRDRSQEIRDAESDLRVEKRIAQIKMRKAYEIMKEVENF
jgi:hypothetical protein